MYIFLFVCILALNAYGQNLPADLYRFFTTSKPVQNKTIPGIGSLHRDSEGFYPFIRLAIVVPIGFVSGLTVGIIKGQLDYKQMHKYDYLEE
jgi:hypothetical protein